MTQSIPQTLPDSREAFEAWFRETYDATAPTREYDIGKALAREWHDSKGRHVKGGLGYRAGSTERLFNAWSAALAALAAQPLAVAAPMEWSVKIMQEWEPRRLRLTIGVQSFNLDIQDEADEPGRMEWHCAQLTGAMQKLTAARAVAAIPEGMPEPEAWRVRYRSEPGMIGHYPWSYTGRKPRCQTDGNNEVEMLYTEAQVRALLSQPPAVQQDRGEALCNCRKANVCEKLPNCRVKFAMRQAASNPGATVQIFSAPSGVDATAQGASGDAETYLRGKYGAYKGHFAWRELEEAFNAGAASPPRGMLECTRSHPHENMDPMCELRTVIARLENEKARRPPPDRHQPTQPRL